MKNCEEDKEQQEEALQQSFESGLYSGIVIATFAYGLLAIVAATI